MTRKAVATYHKKPKPIQNDDAWRNLKKFKGVDASRPDGSLPTKLRD